MFKRKLGISIYPEFFTLDETSKYLKDCYDKEFSTVFLSFVHFVDNTKDKIDLYKKIIKISKKIGYYVIVDINDSSLELFKIKNYNFSVFIEMGIDCLRLDSPMMPKQIADTTYNNDLDFQINISNNDNFVNNILDFKPVNHKIFGCHNFYPLLESGLSWDFFQESTNKFNDLMIHTSAFVGSQFGTRGPQREKIGALVTLEKHRNLNLRTQIKHMFATGIISTVLIGNQPMSNDELNTIPSLKEIEKIELDLKLEKTISEEEKEIIRYTNHFRRGDINDSFIRSTFSRVDFKKDYVKPSVIKNDLKIGEVYIMNSNNYNYQNELYIVIKDSKNKFGNNLNYVGSITSDDLILLDCIDAWDKFKFRIV